MNFRKCFAPLAGAAAMSALAVPAMAQDGSATPNVIASVTAADPSSVVKALGAAGYAGSLTTDDYGAPKVETELASREVTILFYGCDKESHQGCDSLQLLLGFDADKPMKAQQMLDFMDKWRFASMTLDDEGDPWLTWDIVTGAEGIPQPVFLTAIRSFTDTINAAEDMVWPE